ARWCALPHLETIQRAFGHHDVSKVRAQVGGPATAACKAVGATAFAFANIIVFAGPPDLDLAAHEAAHIVQQRSGPAADSEPHADRVAAVVVAGGSAESLLDAYRGSGGPAIQRKGDEARTVHQVQPE